MSPHKPLFRLVLAVLILALGASTQPLTYAQDAEGSPIQFTGTVEAVDGMVITVSGLPVDVSDSAVPIDDLQVGELVQITGVLQNGVVIATTIEIVTAPETTPAPETPPDATETPGENNDDDMNFVIEGPVEKVNINIVTIYNFDIEIEPAHPILKIIKVGDFLRVKGDYRQGKIVAVDISNLAGGEPDSGVSVVVEGPVEAINSNVVTINGMYVQFAPDDPRLGVLKIGDRLKVEGNFQGSGNTIVLVVVNIIIINAPINIGLPPSCKISKNGKIKCSHKKS
jgi:hypothetical protein